MYSAEVVGKLVATVKEANLSNIPLLIVRLIKDGKKAGLLVAADATRQAGEGDFVYLIGSKEAARVFRKEYTAVDAAIVGFIDEYREEL